MAPRVDLTLLFDSFSSVVGITWTVMSRVPFCNTVQFGLRAYKQASSCDRWRRESHFIQWVLMQNVELRACLHNVSFPILAQQKQLAVVRPRGRGEASRAAGDAAAHFLALYLLLGKIQFLAGPRIVRGDEAAVRLECHAPWRLDVRFES